MLTLAEYDKIAIKLIYTYGCRNGKIQISSELIGRVVRFMAIADWRYDANKSKLTRKKYRLMYGICAIREYLKPPKHKHEPLYMDAEFKKLPEQSEESSKKLDFIIKNASLSARESSVIDQILSGYNLSTASENLGISYDQCKHLYKSSVCKMKRISNGSLHFITCF